MIKNIPITKPTIGKEEINAVRNVISSGFIVKGKKTEEAENLLKVYCGRKYAVMLTSGTASLNTATTISGLKKDDEIIVPAFTFIATANAASYVSAKLVFADIEPKSFNINPVDVEKKITKKTKAIIAVDLFGYPYDFGKISNIAKKHKLVLIEDAAQAHGSKYNNKSSGSLGDISIFSFYGSKIITSGEGGMLLTDDKKLYEKALAYRAHGEDLKRKYYFKSIGYNYLPTDIQASILVEQIKKLDKFVSLRRKAANYYTMKLKDIKGLVVPGEDNNVKHSYSCYTIRIKPEFGKRNDVLLNLNTHGVGARVYYPIPLHLQPFWKKLGYNFKKGDFPEAEKACREVLSLPLFPAITKSEQNYVIKTLLESRIKS